MTRLAGEAKLTKPALYRYLRGLEELGFVERRTIATGQAREVELALTGGSLHLELRPSARSAIAWVSPGPVDHDLPLASQIRDVEARREVTLALHGLRATLETVSILRWMHVFVILFGSFARDEQTWKSDIDVLVLTDDGLEEREADLIGEMLPTINDNLDHRLQAHFATRAEFIAQKKEIFREAAEDGMVMHDPSGEEELWQKLQRYKAISL